jgi:predicted RNA-binding protein with PIN domain
VRDVPLPLWGALARAVRRAADRSERSELPAELRPFATWHPDRLTGERPRRAIAAALARDPRLREAVGEALDPALWEDAEHGDAGRLVLHHGAEGAVAALAARGRWDDLATVAAQGADRLAARRRAAADSAASAGAQAGEDQRRRLAEELAEARAERDTQRRRADAAEQRARTLAAKQEQLEQRLDQLRARADALAEQLEEERRRARRQTDRLRQRVAEAESRPAVDATRVHEVADELATLAAALRTALTAPPAPAPPPPVPPTEADPAPSVIPRGVRAAAAGRPAVLPAGVVPGTPLAVVALLQVPGGEVVVDGYNVTKDPLGRPLLSLAEQRAWLVQVAAGVAARFDRRVTVVFDGTEEVPAGALHPRGVRVVFSVGEESADARIVALVAKLDRAQPVLVVSSDREVRDDCAGLGADVVTSHDFLVAAGADGARR